MLDPSAITQLVVEENLISFYSRVRSSDCGPIFILYVIIGDNEVAKS